jgi:hypothetical protein
MVSPDFGEIIYVFDSTLFLAVSGTLKRFMSVE